MEVKQYPGEDEESVSAPEHVDDERSAAAETESDEARKSDAQDSVGSEGGAAPLGGASRVRKDAAPPRHCTEDGLPRD
ncbi:MAG TPA: hypothetical protein VJP86_06530 [Vicinamibacterales bacterium]|nr:hypothetical protein [Vicinamibacterales bacterium]